MHIDYIYENYKKDVYYFLLHMSQNRDISEDLTSEVFLAAIKSLPAFRGDCDIKTWLFSIARLKWFEFLRREKRSRSLHEKLSLYVNEIDYHDSGTVADSDMANRITKLLESEPEKTRQIIFMRIEGFSYYEISQKIGIAESSARVIDFRTKKKIREILAKEGYFDV